MWEIWAFRYFGPFKQLEGFGSYGFPESHAASFALIAYASPVIGRLRFIRSPAINPAR
jgi:hypothetical protein